MIELILATTNGKPTPVNGVTSFGIILLALLIIAVVVGKKK